MLGTGPITAQREMVVEQGHDGHGGRLDVVLCGNDRCVVVELKLTDADVSDTAKHRGYAASTRADALVLLASGGSLDSYDHFQLRR